MYCPGEDLVDVLSDFEVCLFEFGVELVVVVSLVILVVVEEGVGLVVVLGVVSVELSSVVEVISVFDEVCFDGLDFLFGLGGELDDVGEDDGGFYLPVYPVVFSDVVDETKQILLVFIKHGGGCVR